jgi:2-polyprenyl-6-methoxyphenol hydroxylase-like FAD-dependent oxidoreductase
MVRNALLERVQSKSDKIRLHRGYTVQDIVDEPGTSPLQATFVPSTKKDGSFSSSNVDDSVTSEELTLHGCLLVGADGVYSSIRKYLNRFSLEKNVGVTVWRGSITVDPSHPGDADPAYHEILMQLLDKGVLPLGGFRNFGPSVLALFNFHSKRPGTLSWTISSNATDIPAYANVWTTAVEPYVENDEDRQMLQALFALADPEDVWNPITYCVVEPPAEDGRGWGGTGRVVLIGDAAHALRAATGQGGNVAFEDALVLCRTVRELSQHHKFGEYDQMVKLVSKVENERLPRVRKIWNMEHLQAEQNYVNSSVILLTPEYLEWLHNGV